MRLLLLVAARAAALRPLPASVVDGAGLVRYFAFGSNLAAEKMATRGKNSSSLAYARRVVKTQGVERTAETTLTVPGGSDALVLCRRFNRTSWRTC